MRERKASQPKIPATSPGNRNTMSIAKEKCSKGFQKAGRSVQPRKTRKSGIGL